MFRDPFKGRHAKPSRARKLAGVAVFAAVTAAAAASVMLATAQPAPANVVPANIITQLDARTTGSPAQDEAACTAVYHYHHVEAVFDNRARHGIPMTDADVNTGNHAWWHAWHEANTADHDMRQAIHTWLTYGRPWTAVAYACNPDSSI